MQVLSSSIDKSVNFVEEALQGFLESRYVRKVDDYFICYLSSQTGCNRGCAFCHLTVTGQTTFIDSTESDFMGQAIQVFKHYRSSKVPAKYMHYNLMARGEPLANRVLLNSADKILGALGSLAKEYGLPAKFNISTIMPMTFNKSLSEVFNYIHPTIYYSLYSTNLEFRRKWLPTALPVDKSLDILKEYQQFSKKIIKIHHAFIKDENDSVNDVSAMLAEIEKRNLHCEFNLVRYNPFSPEQGEESSPEILHRNVDIIERYLGGKVQIIPRVGPDVKASCGMFVE